MNPVKLWGENPQKADSSPKKWIHHLKNGFINLKSGFITQKVDSSPSASSPLKPDEKQKKVMTTSSMANKPDDKTRPRRKHPMKANKSRLQGFRIPQIRDYNASDPPVGPISTCPKALYGLRMALGHQASTAYRGFPKAS